MRIFSYPLPFLQANPKPRKATTYEALEEENKLCDDDSISHGRGENKAGDAAESRVAGASETVHSLVSEELLVRSGVVAQEGQWW